MKVIRVEGVAESVRKRECVFNKKRHLSRQEVYKQGQWREGATKGEEKERVMEDAGAVCCGAHWCLN